MIDKPASTAKVLQLDSLMLARAVRIHCLKMTSSGGSSHIGSCLSSADILAVLYARVMKVSPGDPRDAARDRFILSKGHAGAAVYAVLALCGFFDVEDLRAHYQDGSVFSGHVSHKGVPGVELSTGSLGHGLGIGVGMANAAKLSGAAFRTYVLMSDGECYEGSNWEAAMFAAHHRLKNICAIIDYNKIQSLGLNSDTIALEPFADKWTSFGWEVRRCDGPVHEQIARAVSPASGDQPVVVIADTVKGKGVSFMEHSVLWHYRTAREQEFSRALAELTKDGHEG
jgi:transketolase